MVIESTYGDRLHEDYSQADLKLERAIENIVKKKGTLMIRLFLWKEPKEFCTR